MTRIRRRLKKTKLSQEKMMMSLQKKLKSLTIDDMTRGLVAHLSGISMGSSTKCQNIWCYYTSTILLLIQMDGWYSDNTEVSKNRDGTHRNASK